MKSTFKFSIIAGALLPLLSNFTQPVLSQTCSNTSEPLVIYRNAGPPIIIENAFNPCKEAEKKAQKLERKREKLARRLEASAVKDNQEIKIDLRP